MPNDPRSPADRAATHDEAAEDRAARQPARGQGHAEHDIAELHAVRRQGDAAGREGTVTGMRATLVRTSETASRCSPRCCFPSGRRPWGATSRCRRRQDQGHAREGRGDGQRCRLGGHLARLHRRQCGRPAGSAWSMPRPSTATPSRRSRPCSGLTSPRRSRLRSPGPGEAALQHARRLRGSHRGRDRAALAHDACSTSCSRALRPRRKGSRSAVTSRARSRPRHPQALPHARRSLPRDGFCAT